MRFKSLRSALILLLTLVVPEITLIMSKEDGTGARAKTPGQLGINSPPGRSLRNRPPIDYRRMNDGNFGRYSGDDFDSKPDLYTDTEREFSDEYDKNPWGASDMKEQTEYLGDGPSAMADEAEISSLRQQLDQLNKEEAALKKKTEVEELKRQVAEKKKAVAKLRGNTCNRKGKTSQTTKQPTKSDDKNILTLRKSKQLRNKVKKELKSTGLINSDDCQSISSASDESSASDISSKSVSHKYSKNKQKSKKSKSSRSSSESKASLSYSSSDSDSDDKKRGHKKIKSGIKAKASDSVRKSQRYPQAHLRFEYVSSNLSFEKLDINLFVAGEIEIISDKRTKEIEKNGRMELLKKIMYLSTSYEFTVLKSYYAAVLREIELGKKSWKDDFQFIETAILSKTVPKSKTMGSKFKKPFVNFSKKKEEWDNSEETSQVWFCNKYQRNKCSSKGSHLLTIKGQVRNAQHICATCWLKDKKKLQHPECSSACTYAA